MDFARKIVESVPRALEAATIRLQGEVQKTLNLTKSTVESRSKPGDPPGNETGTLARSIRHKMLSPTVGVVFTDVEYAKYLEYGAIIRSKSGKMIGFPVSAEGKQLVKSAGGSIRGAITAAKAKYPSLQFRRGGSVVVVGWTPSRGKRGGTFVPLIVLARQAVLQPRPFAQRSVDNARGDMASAFSASLNGQLLKGGV